MHTIQRVTGRKRSVLAFDWARAWSETPSVAGARALQWATGGFYLAGSLIVLWAMVALPSSARDRTLLGAIAAIAFVVGLVLLWRGPRIRQWMYHVTLTLGTALATTAVIAAGGGGSSVALSMMYLFIIFDTLFLFSLRWALVHTVVAEIACATALAVTGEGIGIIVIAAASRIVTATVVGWLSRLAQAAELDPLTSLLNRRGFDRRLREELNHCDRTGKPLALVSLDIDHFKQVNDLQGHHHGDRVLTECSAAWLPLLPARAAMARYGGDEFTLMLPGWPLGRAADLADILRASVPPGVTVSSGVAAANSGDSGSMLISRADVALYEAKTAGRDRTVVHGDPGRAASELENAVVAGELEVHLQPIVELATNTTVCSEALVRWRHPDKGMIPPLQFILEAERNGAIHSLGAWVLGEAARLTTSTGVPRRIAVNASIHELGTRDYAAHFEQVLAAHHVPHGSLVVEVTESALDEGTDEIVLANLARLRELGAEIAIDDFGAGYSSLSRLAAMPIDILKVDGSLIQSIDPDSREAPILEAIAAMARSLGVRLVAEHVETAHQEQIIRALGYDMVQGNRFGTPVPAPRKEQPVASTAEANR